MPIKFKERFTEEDKKEYEEITLDQLYQGLSCQEISANLGISPSSVQKIRDKLIDDKKISMDQINKAREERKKKEKEKNKQLILKGLKQGKSNKELLDDVSCGEKTVRAIIRELIEEGAITEKEIEEARRKSDKEDEDRETEKLEKQMLVLLEEGYTVIEIKSKLSKSTTIICQIRDKLIAEGKITEERIKEARKERKNRINAGNIVESSVDDILDEEITEELKEKVLGLLRKGYHYKQIPRKLKIQLITANRVKEILIKEGRITEEEIIRRRAEREESDEITVYRFVMRGYSQSEIASEIERSKKYVQDRIDGLKAKGMLTDAIIEKAKYDNNERSIKKYILGGLREGLTQKEIADQDETGYLTRENVKRYKNKLVAEGEITEDEIVEARIKARQRRVTERKKKNTGPYDEKILKLLNLGFFQYEIKKILDLTEYYVGSRVDILVLKKSITENRIRNAQRNREEMANNRRKRMSAAIDGIGTLKMKDVENHIEYFRAILKIGKPEFKDVELLHGAISDIGELMTLSNIRLIITGYVSVNKPQLALRFINECAFMCADNSNLLEKLEKARKEVIMYINNQEAVKRNGKNASVSRNNANKRSDKQIEI